jgi:sporulation protein YlmC with PRC-barrel domain
MALALRCLLFGCALIIAAGPGAAGSERQQPQAVLGQALAPAISATALLGHVVVDDRTDEALGHISDILIDRRSGRVTHYVMVSIEDGRERVARIPADRIRLADDSVRLDVPPEPREPEVQMFPPGDPTIPPQLQHGEPAPLQLQ